MGKKHLDCTTRHINFGVSTSKETEPPLRLLQKVRGVTPNHRVYLRAIDSSKLTFCLGPAGTGKTWQAAGKAAAMLVDGDVKRIVITRPLVTCGRDRIGFLPGDKNQKVSPHMLPLLDAFEDFLGSKTVDKLIEAEVIVMSPLEMMRGSNIRDSFIICDEAQNAEYGQLHMFLTRFAKGSKVVVTGDISQSDLPYEGVNSLERVIERFRPDCHEDISIVALDHGDVMRDELTSWIDMRLLGIDTKRGPQQERSCTPVVDEDQFAENSVYVRPCEWCETLCGMKDELPTQFECWSCTSLTSLDEGGIASFATVRDGVCSKTFKMDE